MSAHIPILLYHSVSDTSDPRFARWVVSPECFADHMAHLRDQHYTALTITQLAAPGRQLPPRPVVITFDDGLADFYSAAFPILRRHALTATLFVTTGFVGGTSRWLRPQGEGDRPMLTWGQLRELAAAGVECGAHSHTHPELDTLPIGRAREEIVRSKTCLEDGLGQSVEAFAYPHGYHSRAVRRQVREAGFSSACAVRHAMRSLDDDRFALPRLIVTADMDLPEFARLVRGQRVGGAPRREPLRTIGWRWARRTAAVVRRWREPERGR